MAAYTTFKLFLLMALLALTMPFLATTGRRLNHFFASTNLIRSNSNLTAKLNLDEESSNFWDSLFQLQACSGEPFRPLSIHCWPTLLGTLGFTAKETNVLKGYCDEVNHVKSLLANPPSPPSIHDPINAEVVPDLEKLVP
ncbi:unnamed protein product [Prunus brigantina]